MEGRVENGDPTATRLAAAGVRLKHGWLSSVDVESCRSMPPYPIIEVYQALKAYNLTGETWSRMTMLDAVTRGNGSTTWRAVPGATRSIEALGQTKPREDGVGSACAARRRGQVLPRASTGAERNPRLPLLRTGSRSAPTASCRNGGWYVQFELDVRLLRKFRPGRPVESSGSVARSAAHTTVANEEERVPWLEQSALAEYSSTGPRESDRVQRTVPGVQGRSVHSRKDCRGMLDQGDRRSLLRGGAGTAGAGLVARWRPAERRRRQATANPRW